MRVARGAATVRARRVQQRARARVIAAERKKPRSRKRRA
jgi:hypothetical protein